MSKDIDRLLQECLAGLDTGLTPEECLSAWPARRAELEPLLRQAMLLRLAYRSTAAPEFKVATREKLMFMAGRETRQALDAQPSEDFVRQTRRRVLRAAGDAAQESLRAVPPPRLAFWMNARRRLLEAAISRPSQSPRGGILAYRSALSAAVVVLAIAVAGFAYFTTQSPRPSVSAELASIDQQLRQVERQSTAGNPISPDNVVAIADKVVAVADKVNSDPAQTATAQDLIDRSKALVQQAAQSPSAPPALKTAERKLSDAEVRIAAAGGSEPFTPSAQAQPTLAPINTAVPSTAAPAASTAAASAATAVPAQVLAPLGPNEVRVHVLPGDSSLIEIETVRFRIVIPAAWQIIGPTFDANGVGVLESTKLRFDGPDNLLIFADVSTGEIQAIVNGTALRDPLRSKTALGGFRMPVNELVSQTGALAGQLNDMLNSVVHIAPTPTPTATPSATPAATATPQPPPATPTP